MGTSEAIRSIQLPLTKFRAQSVHGVVCVDHTPQLQTYVMMVVLSLKDLSMSTNTPIRIRGKIEECMGEKA